MPLLTILTNTPTPYRTAFFNALSRMTDEAGVRLRVIYCAKREPHRQWEVELDQQKFEWKILRGIHPSFRGVNPHFNPGIIPELWRDRPDWLVVAGAWNTPTMLIASQPLLRLARHRIFWSEGHSEAVMHPRGPVAWGRQRVYGFFDGFAVPNIRSEAYVRSLTGERKPILRLPNTVDEELYARAVGIRETGHVRRELSIERNAPVLCLVSQLTPRKGVREVLEAFAALPPTQDPRPVLLVAGEGPLRSELEEMAKRSRWGEVRFVGHQDGAGVTRLLAASEGFILGSFRDPNPLAPIEAAFAQLPLLLSRNTGNCSDLVEKNVTGFSFDPADPRSLESALQGWLSVGREGRLEMGRKAGARAWETLTRSAIAASFLRTLRAAFPA